MATYYLCQGGEVSSIFCVFCVTENLVDGQVSARIKQLIHQKRKPNKYVLLLEILKMDNTDRELYKNCLKISVKLIFDANNLLKMNPNHSFNSLSEVRVFTVWYLVLYSVSDVLYRYCYALNIIEKYPYHM